jgi:hypothetical protein
MDYVDRVEKFEWYINAAKPDIMKVDVEGSEIFMNAIKPELFKDITNIAVEYHNLPCLVSVERLFRDNGYKLEYYKFNHLDIDFQGVIHAYKPTNLFVELEKIK